MSNNQKKPVLGEKKSFLGSWWFISNLSHKNRVGVAWSDLIDSGLSTQEPIQLKIWGFRQIITS